jgi:hypothetical protein
VLIGPDIVSDIRVNLPSAHFALGNIPPAQPPSITQGLSSIGSLYPPPFIPLSILLRPHLLDPDCLRLFACKLPRTTEYLRDKCSQHPKFRIHDSGILVLVRHVGPVKADVLQVRSQISARGGLSILLRKRVYR